MLRFWSVEEAMENVRNKSGETTSPFFSDKTTWALLRAMLDSKELGDMISVTQPLCESPKYVTVISKTLEDIDPESRSACLLGGDLSTLFV